jgi:hypothetical protein
VTGGQRSAVPDQVARWEELRFQYPQASYATDGGWFYGALRDDDMPLKASSLERLTDALLAREEGP